MSSDDSGMQAVLGQELQKFVEPLVTAFTSGEQGFAQFMRSDVVGDLLNDTEIEKVYAALNETDGFGSAVETVASFAQKDQASLADVVSLIEASVTIVKGIKRVDDLNVSIDAESVANLGDHIVDYLTARYLSEYHPIVHHAFCVAGVLQYSPPANQAEIDFSSLGTLFSNPADFATDAYNWGTDDFQAFLLLYYVYDTLYQFSLPGSFYEPPEGEVTNALPGGSFQESDYPYDDVMGDLGELLDEEPGEMSERAKIAHQISATPNRPAQGLRVPLFFGEFGELGLKSVPLPKGSSHPPGFTMELYGAANVSETIQLSPAWTATASFSTQQDVGFRFLPENDQGGLQADPIDTSLDTPIEAGIKVAHEPQGEDEETVLLGAGDGTRLSLTSLSVGGSAAYTDSGIELSAELPTEGKIVIKPQGGFLKKILPPAGVTGGFGVTVGWANTRGVYFDGSAKLSTTIPVNESIGKKGAKLEIAEVYLAIEVGGDEADVRLTGAVTATAQLGPISGTVREMGVHGDLSFPADRDGNLGPVDLTAEFKPPTGAGLSLDSPGISGGGFLGYDPENERYSAIISLTIGPVQVQVFGLLATEMPDGSDGFSLLISVFGTFPPVQLSFGFTLNGLGGVLGINRALRAKPLRKAARTGSLDNVLFPENPAANPTQLVSDLRSIYPVTEGQHVFGPMAQLGWGTPSLILLDLGIVLQLPKFKIAILGTLRIAFPSLEVPDLAQTMRLNLSVAGTIEPQKKLVALAASLFDSRLMQWTVKGAMAMRLKWGAKPEFLFAIGGFHPKFKPPDSFPKVTPVTISLAIPGGNPSISWSGYFAVTSNTVQVGASFDARFTAGPARAKGWWSIDALFQFKPFKFVVGLSAGIEVRVKGFSLSIRLEGSLKGPEPTRIKGKLSIKLPGPLPNLSPRVDITLGEEGSTETSLPTANVLEELSKQVQKPGNWAAQLPDDGEELVSVRDVDADDSTVLAHPMGRLSVRQTTVPLKTGVETYGENRPIHREFDLEIGTATGGSLPTLADTKESFAPEKYEEMSDSEKLNAPSFVDMTAGREAEGDLLHWGCEIPDGSGSETDEPENAASAELLYEPSREEPFPDRELPEDQLNLEAEDAVADGGDQGEPPRPSYPPEVTRSLSDDGSVANAERRHTGDGKFRPDGPEYDPPERKSNGVVTGEPLVVMRDPGILDTLAVTAQAGSNGGGSA